MNVFARQVVSWSVMTRHGAALTPQALLVALLYHGRPTIFHSDNGRAYQATAFAGALTEVGTSIARLTPGCPWENG